VDIKKGDTVQVISGKDRGKRGLVLRTSPKEDRVVVEGINIHKKHTRQNKQTGSGRSFKGGTIEFPAPMHVSNVMLVCPKCNEPSRMRHTQGGEHGGRVCQSCGASVDAR
jgi:large subunit ribosomal protein L24